MKIVTFDTETAYRETDKHWAVQNLVCTTFAWGLGTDERKLYVGKDAHKPLLRALTSKEHTLVAHNAIFDVNVCIKAFPDLKPLFEQAMLEGRIRDTQLRERMVNNAKGTYHKESLSACIERYFGEHLEKADTWRLRYAELVGTKLEDWPEEAVTYALDDATSTLRLYYEQEHRHSSLYTTNEDGNAVRYAYALHHGTIRGLCVDAQAITELEKKTVETVNSTLAPLLRNGLLVPEVDENEARLYAKMRVRFRRDDEAARAVIVESYNKLGQAPPYTDKGTIAIDSFSCNTSRSSVLTALATYNTNVAILNKDIKFLREGYSAGGVHTRYSVLKATGRVSSSGPNLQNLKRGGGIRECFIPEDGKVFVFADYGSAELHTLAQVQKDWYGTSTLGDLILSGKDLHIYFAAEILNTSYDKLYEKYKSGSKKAIEYRQLAKAANYGLGGLAGARRFAAMCLESGVNLAPVGQSALKKLSDEDATTLANEFRRTARYMYEKDFHLLKTGEQDPTKLWVVKAACEEPTKPGAKQAMLHYAGFSVAEFGAHVIREKWYDTFPEMHQYAKDAKARAKEGYMGIPRTGLYRKVPSVSAAANTPFQGMAARGALEAVWQVVTQPQHGFEFLIFIHDEIGGQTSHTHAPKCAEWLAETMMSCFNIVTPDYPVKVEASIKERWTK